MRDVAESKQALAVSSEVCRRLFPTKCSCVVSACCIDQSRGSEPNESRRAADTAASLNFRYRLQIVKIKSDEV